MTTTRSRKAAPASKTQGTLYVVSTPIGNLEDITLRAVRVLKQVVLIAAEDTRWSRKLLSRHDVHTPMTSYHEHNKEQKAVEILQRLKEGKDVALVTDAGTPGVSDPGYVLLKAAVEGGIEVCPVPGPSAAVAALSVAGLPTDRFCFEGFLPSRGPARRRRLEELKAEPRTMIFFESPRRLLAVLKDMHQVWVEERTTAVARELTKIHEEIVRGPLSEVIREMEGRHIRGEITLVVEGRAQEKAGHHAVDAAGEATETMTSAKEVIRSLMAQGDLGVKEVAALVAKKLGIPRRIAYHIALEIKSKKPR